MFGRTLVHASSFSYRYSKRNLIFSSGESYLVVADASRINRMANNHSSVFQYLCAGKICQHLLYHHLGITYVTSHHFGPDIEAVLRLPEWHPQSKTYSTGEEASVACITAMDDLHAAVRSVELNLAVTHFATASPLLGHSEVFPLPLTSDEETVKEQLDKIHVSDVVEVLVFLERSGKWPRDMDAVDTVRADFHRIIFNGLKKKGIVTEYAPEGRYVYAIVHGFVFRLRVTYQGELLMLRKMADTPLTKPDAVIDDESEMLFDTPGSIQLQIDSYIAPTIASALKGISSAHSSYGGCVRLCRRWLQSQMVEPKMPTLATQLLVANLYINAGRFRVPATPYVGFLRFVEFLSRQTDFEASPIFVNLNQDFSKEDRDELELRFNKNRGSFPALTIFTPYDIRGNPENIAKAGGIKNVDVSHLAHRFVYFLLQSTHYFNFIPSGCRFQH